MYKVTHYSGEYRLQARRRVRQEAGQTNFSRRSCVLSCHSKAAELPLSASGKKHSCMCVSEGHEMKQVITLLITWRFEE